MTPHSMPTSSPSPPNQPRNRLPRRLWPTPLVIIATLLVAVTFAFNAGSTVHATDSETANLTLTSPNPGEFVITWDAPSRAPTDYRVTWKKSDAKWRSYKDENTVEGGNAYPAGTSHTVTGLEEGTGLQGAGAGPLLRRQRQP